MINTAFIVRQYNIFQIACENAVAKPQRCTALMLVQTAKLPAPSNKLQALIPLRAPMPFASERQFPNAGTC